MDFETLVASARQECQLLEAAIRKQLMGLSSVETGLGQVGDQVRVSVEGLEKSMAGAREQLAQWEQEGRAQTARISSALEESRERVETLEGGLAAQLETLPGSLSGLREQARAAAPQLTAAVGSLRQRVHQLEADVDRLLHGLEQEISHAAQGVRKLHADAAAQRESLDRALAECFAEAQALRGEGDQATERLGGRLREVSEEGARQVSLVREQATAGLEMARRRLAESLVEKPARRLKEEAQRSVAALEHLQSACEKQGSHAVEEAGTLRQAQAAGCEALQPWAGLHAEAVQSGLA